MDRNEARGVVDAYIEGPLLFVPQCCFCGREHWHMRAGSRLRDANCERRFLPKHLRDRHLLYFLWLVRDVYQHGEAEVIAFRR